MPAADTHAQPCLQVAVPVPLRRRFDYLPPEDADPVEVWQWQPGCRIRVPFGPQELVGVLLAVVPYTPPSDWELRPALARLDAEPVLPPGLLDLCLWAADYYQCPPGEALHTALPALLRQGEAAALKEDPVWCLTTEGKGLPEGALKKAKRQAQLLALLQERQQLHQSDLKALDIPTAALRALQDKGLVRALESAPPQLPEPGAPVLREAALTLNREQSAALEAIDPSTFQVSLLDGTTGSGKTEVYLQAIARVLEAGRQALVLVPEIGLTPQTLARFERRFAQPVVALHSGLNDRERLNAWLRAASGEARVVIGTRSAVFTPLPTPGIIIVDEEHDGSFKQQDGFRYSARDLAAVRAHREQIPLLLGSATPSLETLNNARLGRYQQLRLTRRAGAARPPVVHLQDIRSRPLQEGFSQHTLEAIGAEIATGNQVLVFINRRGYAPTLQCHDCGWLAECNHCDARMTVHNSPPHLHCHHCDHQRPLPRRCPECHSSRLEPLGTGTERSEELLAAQFPHTRVIRADRDSTRGKNAMNRLLEEVHSGEPCILVGTQMLAKGHHFSDVTLVVILNADAGLFSTDFRGPERMGQLLVQVAGRAGRAEKPGNVILQSHHTDHPLVQTLVNEGYHAFAERVLQERQATRLPPFRHLGLLRAESKRAENARAFLQAALLLARQIHPPSPAMGYLGPLPAMLEKRNNRYRYQLQFSASQRRPLQALLQQLATQLENHALARRVRWSIDVDPQEMG